MSIDIFYFSNYSGNTKRFAERLGEDSIRIPIDYGPLTGPVATRDYVLLVPTYGGGSEKSAIPKQVKSFLNLPGNRSFLRGVVGLGNTNFGDNFCKAADIISAKTGVPIIARVEIFGTPEDVEIVKERLTLLYGQ